MLMGILQANMSIASAEGNFIVTHAKRSSNFTSVLDKYLMACAAIPSRAFLRSGDGLSPSPLSVSTKKPQSGSVDQIKIGEFNRIALGKAECITWQQGTKQ
jgi:hypothetical protein